MLWDLDNPLLYKAVSSIYIDGRLADRCITSFGVRDIYFDAQKGFFLNGTHLKIKGVCCHHDHAVGGIAANDCIQEYRLRQLKKMGANAYRSAHHMPTQELLEMCDRIGMLVFDETRPVSYTHLDVYKRQGHGSNSLCIAECGFRPFEPDPGVFGKRAYRFLCES